MKIKVLSSQPHRRISHSIEFIKTEKGLVMSLLETFIFIFHSYLIFNEKKNIIVIVL